MRLAVATALLVQSFPASSSSSIAKDVRRVNKVERPDQKRRRSLSVPLNVGKESIKVDRKTKLVKEVKALKNLVSNLVPAIECDPTFSSVDVGLLSCGTGQYCAESADSLLGGICMDVVTGQRALQDDNSTYLSTVQSIFCEYNNATCSCSGYDATAYTLDVTCAFPTSCDGQDSYCGGSFEHCFSADQTISFLGAGLYTKSTCFKNSAPYEQDVCYRGSSTILLLVKCPLGVSRATHVRSITCTLRVVIRLGTATYTTSRKLVTSLTVPTPPAHIQVSGAQKKRNRVAAGTRCLPTDPCGVT